MVVAKARILLVIVLTLAFGANVKAAPSAALKGQNPIELSVGRLDEDATKCGISRDSLEAAMRIPLSNSPLKVREGPLYPVLYAAITVLRQSGLCAVSVNVEFLRIMWLSKGEDAELDFVSAWRDGTLLTGDSATMGRRVADKVEDLTKRFIGAWLKAND